MSSQEQGFSSSYFVPKDSVCHQSSTCFFNDSSTFRTWCTCITCRRSGFTIDLTQPARVQPKAVRIAMGCPGQPLHTSCCNIASNTFAQIVTSSESTSEMPRSVRCRKSCTIVRVTLCRGDSTLVLSRFLPWLSGHLFLDPQQHQRGMTLFSNVLAHQTS